MDPLDTLNDDLHRFKTKPMLRDEIIAICKARPAYAFEFIRNPHVALPLKKKLVDMFKSNYPSVIHLTFLVRYIREYTDKKLLTLILQDDSYPTDPTFQNLLALDYVAS